MGREAKSCCTQANETAFCSVLLKPRELVVRGVTHRRIPFCLLTNVEVKGELLVFAWEKNTYLSLTTQPLFLGGLKR